MKFCNFENIIITLWQQLFIDVYAQVIDKSPLIKDMMKTLHDKVKEEVNLQKEVAKVIGSLEMVFTKGMMK